MVKLHFLTRCSRPENLTTIQQSLYTEDVDVLWHILFDCKSIKDLDSELLLSISKSNTFLYFTKSDKNDYLYPQLSLVIEKITDGYVTILDDDNIVHPDFFLNIKREISSHSDKKVFVYDQQVDGKDFTGLTIRKAIPENMVLKGVDSGQYVIEKSIYNNFKYQPGYDSDGKFIELLFNKYPSIFHFVPKVLCYYNFLQKPRTITAPRVVYIGPGAPVFTSKSHLGYEDTSLNTFYYDSDFHLQDILNKHNPDCILTISEDFTVNSNLCASSQEVRRKWINVPKIDEETGEAAYNCSMNHILDSNRDYLISYFTPFYNTGDKLWNTYNSLKRQTYQDWEWVLVNDSTDNGKTLKIAEEIAKVDNRVKVYDFRYKTNGVIGEAKYRAAALTSGKWLAELDHDDILVETCSEDIIKASTRFPDAGFIYGDSAEVDENWNSLKYSDGFSFGYGKYRKVKYGNLELDVAESSNINPLTIRHIVGVPNHIRVWRRDVYFAVGGHNRNLTVADDYELIVRTFLTTRFIKVSKLTYIQFMYSSSQEQNTHDFSRMDIQRRVRTIMYYYNDKIAKRFKELGVEDWAYKTNPNFPLEVPSRFGKKENYVNYTFND